SGTASDPRGGTACTELLSLVPCLNPPPLPGAATVVRLRSDVLDAGHFKAGGLERANGGLTSGTRTFDEHLDLLEAVLDSLAGGRVGGDLGGKGRRLARALESGA